MVRLNVYRPCIECPFRKFETVDVRKDLKVETIEQCAHEPVCIRIVREFPIAHKEMK